LVIRLSGKAEPVPMILAAYVIIRACLLIVSVFTTCRLTHKIRAISIKGISNCLDIFRQFNLIAYVVKPLKPLLKILGIEKKVGMLWLTAGLMFFASAVRGGKVSASVCVRRVSKASGWLMGKNRV